MKLAVFASLLLILPFQTQAFSCVGKKVDAWVIQSGHGGHGPDTYVKVTIGSDTKTTKMVHGNSDKVLRQKLHVSKAASSDMMRVEIMKADGQMRLRTCDEPMMDEGIRWRNFECKTPEHGAVKIYYRCF